MNLDRLKSLRSEVNSQPNEKWVLLDRKEISHFLLQLELLESVMLGEGGVGSAAARGRITQGETE
jgi:hypothetical protein